MNISRIKIQILCGLVHAGNLTCRRYRWHCRLSLVVRPCLDVGLSGINDTSLNSAMTPGFIVNLHNKVRCHSWVIERVSEAELLTNDARLLNYTTSLCYVHSTMTSGVIAELGEVYLMPLSRMMLLQRLKIWNEFSFSFKFWESNLNLNKKSYCCAVFFTGSSE